MRLVCVCCENLMIKVFFKNEKLLINVDNYFGEKKDISIFYIEMLIEEVQIIVGLAWLECFTGLCNNEST